jgi:hypothetical protein
MLRMLSLKTWMKARGLKKVREQTAVRRYSWFGTARGCSGMLFKRKCAATLIMV